MSSDLVEKFLTWITFLNFFIYSKSLLISALVSLRIRIQGAKPMIHVDANPVTSQYLPSQKVGF